MVYCSRIRWVGRQASTVSTRSEQGSLCVGLPKRGVYEYWDGGLACVRRVAARCCGPGGVVEL